MQQGRKVSRTIEFSLELHITVLHSHLNCGHYFYLESGTNRKVESVIVTPYDGHRLPRKWV